LTYSFPQPAIDFLIDLEENNTKEWFQANKKRYERTLKAAAREFVSEVNEAMEAVSPAHATDAPHKRLSRINRDIRFSKDKTPYNTHVWAGFHASDAPRGSAAGYFVGLSPTGWGVGGGCWKPPAEAMDSLRSYIAARQSEFEAIISDPEFAAVFPEISGEKYKRVPKPWPADHPAGEWLKHKGIHTRCDAGGDLLTSEDLLAEIERRFRILKPFVDFLSAGLGDA